MSRYKFVNASDVEYIVLNESFKLLEESNPVEADLVERSFEAGSELPGIQRDESKEFVFQYDENHPTETEFRDQMNEYLYYARNAVKIIDTVINREIPVVFIDNTISYDAGGFKNGAICQTTFQALLPYWRDVDYQIESDSGVSADTQIITNNGWVDAAPVFTITALEQITKFSIRNLTTGLGILIQDLQFGILGLNTYIIDMEEGTVELNGFSRESRIKGGTGFFKLPVGSSILEFTLNGQATIETKFKRRYYI